MLSGIERDVLTAIDEDRVVADLAELVRIPSVDGTAAEADVQRWCAERLAGLGLAVDHWPIDLDARRADPDFPGSEVERGEAWGCVGVLGSGGPPGLVLNGHVDVVPPAGPEPFGARVRDGVMYGRGTCDMKGGVAAVIGAVSAVVSAVRRSPGQSRCTASSGRRTAASARSPRCGAGTGARPA